MPDLGARGRRRERSRLEEEKPVKAAPGPLGCVGVGVRVQDLRERRALRPPLEPEGEEPPGTEPSDLSALMFSRKQRGPGRARAGVQPV